jgi:hypothetical protein
MVGNYKDRMEEIDMTYRLEKGYVRKREIIRGV